MALNFGKNKRASSFKRSAYPMQSGTASHASALKSSDKVTELTNAKAEQETAKIKEGELKKQAEKLEKETFESDEALSKRKSSKTTNLEGKLKKTKTRKSYKKSDQFKKDKEEFKKTDAYKNGDASWLEDGLPAARKEYAANPNNTDAINSSRSRKSDRQTEKLASSKRYDDMSIEERTKHKQEVADNRDKRIRNTISTIDDIIPASFGGGRGTTKNQTAKELTAKPKFSGKNYLTAAEEGGNITPPEKKSTLSDAVKKGGTSVVNTTKELTAQEIAERDMISKENRLDTK
tara:strand:+ start:40 stop:912 length:873 start_codon:yes stop_codon:yes gene_type:complete